MSKKPRKNQKNSNHTGHNRIKKSGSITEFRLKSNNLTVLYMHIPGTGVVTTNLTYKVGARDEQSGETGIAHMLEHMLFKPTKHDLKRKIDSGAMHFERETGCLLNANTWKDRTTYFFNYPVEHLRRALRVEAERMQDVVLSSKEFLPERGNVLSEFDMYNGDPHFALSVQMVCAAYHSHPYGHETIGFREDIEEYTPERLERFYKDYYRPDNATMMVIGDVDEATALREIRRAFGSLKNPSTPIIRHGIREPKQEGTRRVSIQRDSSTNLVSIGVKHAGFPTTDWFTTSALFSVLTAGPDSILHKKLVDTNLATSVEGMLEPTSEENLGLLTITLAPKQQHDVIEKIVLDTIRSLKANDVRRLLKKVVQKTITDELFSRSSSVRIAMELTEYVSANSWETFNDTEKILAALSPKELTTMSDTLFDEKKLTIGYFIGTK